jgi:hypothetical protein
MDADALARNNPRLWRLASLQIGRLTQSNTGDTTERANAREHEKRAAISASRALHKTYESGPKKPPVDPTALISAIAAGAPPSAPPSLGQWDRNREPCRGTRAIRNCSPTASITAKSGWIKPVNS